MFWVYYIDLLCNKDKIVMVVHAFNEKESRILKLKS